MPETGSLGPLPLLLASGALLLILLGSLAGLALRQQFGSRARLLRRIEPFARVRRGQTEVRIDNTARRKVIQSKLKDLEEKRRKTQSGGLKDDIAQAGLTLSVRKFVVVSVIMGGVGGFLGLVMGFGPVTLGLTVISFGVDLPRYVVRWMIRRRIRKFTTHFVSAIDIIVRGIRTGLPVGECLNVVSREIEDPVGLEFRLLTEGQRLGMTLDDVLGRAVQRMRTPELKFFSIVLIIQKQTGGNLADTLEKLSDVLRERKKMRDKVQALSSEAKASAMIIGALPFILALLLYIIQPGYLMPLFTETLGHVMLVGAGVWMSIGVLIMQKMINFEL
ncbi:MAG: type II secretion system F family protein [Alphaproteobacteria bacterium]